MAFFRPMRTILTQKSILVAGVALVFGGAVLFGGASLALARANHPPVITLLTAPTKLVVGETGTWEVQAQDRNLEKLAFRVSWGDGLTELRVPSYRRKASFTYVYKEAGIYTVSLSVTDEHGAHDEVQQIIEVRTIEQPTYAELDVIMLNNEVPGKQILGKTGTGTGADAEEVSLFMLSANNNDVNLKKLVFKEMNGNGLALKRVYLAEKTGGRIIASTSVITSGDTITFDGLAELIQQHTSRAFSVLIDTNGATDQSGAHSGDKIRFQIADARTDIEAKDNTKNIYAAPLVPSGSDGVVIAMPVKQGSSTDISAIDEKMITFNVLGLMGNQFRAGNLILVSANGSGVQCGGKLAQGDEYMLITDVWVGDIQTLTVRRGSAGTAPFPHPSTSDTRECQTSYQANTHVIYAARINVSDPVSKPSGTLMPWTTFTPVFQFTITPDARSEEDALLNRVIINLALADGIGNDPTRDWKISETRLKNNVGAVIGTIEGSISDRTTPLDFGKQIPLNEFISGGGETFTVEVTVSGTVGDSGTDVLQMAIPNFGAIAPQGTISPGAVRWSDSISKEIQWIVDSAGHALKPVEGGLFQKSAS